MSQSRTGVDTERTLDRRQFLGTALALAGAPLMGQPPAVRGPDVLRHVVAWRQAGRYGGWPANHGIWNWDDEIVCGCTAGHMKTGDPNRHPIDRSAGEAHALLRSVDGGLTWTFETPPALVPPPRPERIALTGETPVVPSSRPLDTPIDFTAPDLALTFRKSHDRPGAWLFVSQDRARTWTGPWHVPALDVPTYDPRTDYLVVGRRELLVS